jgi:hypothetical protein
MSKNTKPIACSAIFFVCVITATAQIHVTAALCENKVNPQGTNLTGLHFSWELDSKKAGQYQSAYQLVMATSVAKLDAADYDVYNSQKINNSQSIMAGCSKQLQPAQIYYWKVRVWDKLGRRGAWSTNQQFITGVFSGNDWGNAKWIGYEELADSLRVAPGVHEPDAPDLGSYKCVKRPVIPLFRKEFVVHKAIKTALLFVTGLGTYEVSVNGEKQGKAFLSPGWTYYDKTVLYNTYDVTHELAEGINTIGLMVGNGFYNINRERYFKIVTAFGMPKMICCLKLQYDDGTVQNVVSDASWRTAPSPITFTSIYGGEDYDAQEEQKGWTGSGFNDANWKPAMLVKAPAGSLMPEEDYPVALMDSFNVKKIWKPKPGTYMYDFGQNASGIVRLKIKGKKGQTVKLIPAELTNSLNMGNQSATGEPYYFSYTLKGDSEEVWQPRFSYYGFRYVQVEGAVPDTANNPAALPAIIALTALHNRNSNPANGTFECSNTLFNRIYNLINWAIESNVQSVVTDCPHREKLSWLEQDYLMGASIHYNFDIYGLYKKLVHDLMDAQYPKGFVPDIAPEFVVFQGGFLDSPEWGSASAILPWMLYKWYGDKEVLKSAYPMVKKYVDYLEGKSSNHILSYGLGDWYDYGPKPPGEAQLTPKAVTATSIFYYDATLLTKMAVVLHYTQDVQQYNLLSAEIKNAFNNKFFNASKKVYSTGSQTAMAMPLCVGLADGQYKKDILKNLIDTINSQNKALTAGDIGFHFLIQALDEGGAAQLIYEMNNRDDVPGYGFQLKKGATSLTESWPALENVSNNHLMLGHIMEWFYGGLAGISQEDSSVAFKNITIRPQPVGDITYAKGSFHSPYGWVTTFWEKKNGHFVLQVHIPVNATAKVYLPFKTGSTVRVNGILKKEASFNVKAGAAVIPTSSGDYMFDVE